MDRSEINSQQQTKSTEVVEDIMIKKEITREASSSQQLTSKDIEAKQKEEKHDGTKIIKILKLLWRKTRRKNVRHVEEEDIDAVFDTKSRSSKSNKTVHETDAVFNKEFQSSNKSNSGAQEQTNSGTEKQKDSPKKPHKTSLKKTQTQINPDGNLSD